MVSKEYLQAKQAVIRDELMTYSLPFWAKVGPDKENGGFFTCVTREGKLSSHDKNAWQQGRAAWTFSRASNQYGRNEEYLAIAKSCLDFMDAHFIDPKDGEMYYTCTATGASDEEPVPGSTVVPLTRVSSPLTSRVSSLR